METQNKDGPQYPASEGAKISGEPVQSVETQGVMRGQATCVIHRGQELSPGLLSRRATGETSASQPTTALELHPAIRPIKGATPVMVGPPPTVPLGPSPKSLKKSAKRRARKALLLAEAKAGDETPSQPQTLPSTSQQMEIVPESTVEAGSGLLEKSPSSSSSDGASSDYVGGRTTGDEEMLLASPSEQAAAETDLASSAPAEGVTEGTSESVTGRKRKTEVGPTPPQTKRKKSRKGPAFGSTFKQAEQDDLLGVVLVKDRPYTVLSRTQLEYVRSELMKQLFEAAANSRDREIPRFEESGTRYGRFHLSCANEFSYQWLTEAVTLITVPTEDGTEPHHLHLVTSSEVPKLLRAEVFISGPPSSVWQFRRLIQVQNDGLHTDRWLLRHQQKTDRSMLMVWNIDKESADALQLIGDRPHFGLGRVTFKVSRGPDPGGTH